MGDRDFYINGECKNCHLVRGENKHDPCIENLPGVVYACCGHGITKGMIKFDDGRILEFDPFSITLDVATHEIKNTGTAVYITKNPPRTFYFRSRRIRKSISGTMDTRFLFNRRQLRLKRKGK